MMSDERAKRTAIVMVYRDDSKKELLVEVPIIDLGIETGGATRPNSDEGLIRIAKMQIHATRSEAADSLYYEVRG
jgi:hypothetical protein